MINTNQMREYLYKSFPPLEALDLLSALLIVFLMPVNHWILRPVIIFWVFIRLLALIIHKKNRLTVSRQKNFLLLISLLIFINYGIGILYSEDLSQALSHQERLLTMFLFPLLFISSDYLFKQHSSKIVLAFIFGCFTACLICYILAFRNAISLEEGRFIFDPYVSGEYIDKNVPRNNHFRYSNLSFSHHPYYLSIYLILALIFNLNGLRDKTQDNKYLRVFLVLSLILFILTLYLLSSKAAVILFIFTMVLYALIYLKRRLYRLYFLAAVTILGVISLTNSRFYYLGKTILEINTMIEYLDQKDYKATIDHFGIDRPAYWAIALEQIKDHPLVGVGTGDAEETLRGLYIKYNLKTAAENNYNVHNQFLETAVSLGFIGFVVLFGTFLFMFIIGWRLRNYELVLFIFLFSLACMFESMFNTFAGILFYAYFSNYLLFHGSVGKLEIHR